MDQYVKQFQLTVKVTAEGHSNLVKYSDDLLALIVQSQDYEQETTIFEWDDERNEYYWVSYEEYEDACSAVKYALYEGRDYEKDPE